MLIIIMHEMNKITVLLLTERVKKCTEVQNVQATAYAYVNIFRDLAVSIEIELQSARQISHPPSTEFAPSVFQPSEFFLMLSEHLVM